MALPSASRSTRDRTRYLLLFAALFVPFSYFNHSDGWNQAARLATLHAVVIQKTLRIDAYHELTGDKALIDGHYYSEKAPTIVAAALPVFALTVFAQRLAGVEPDSPSGWRVSEWIATAAAVGAIAALGGVAFFALLESRLGTPVALLSTFGVFFGTMTFPYATALFAHGGTIGLLAIALWGALGAKAPARDYVAGLAAGFAAASEYPAVFSCGVIGLYLGYLDRGRLWRFGLATLPALALILANNYAISGSAFQLSYGSNPVFPEMTTGNWMGFQLPSLARMSGLLFSEYRGLFFWSPLLLMALPGMFELYRADRPVAILIASGFALTFLQAAAFYNWFGGNSVGPRYLAPALPFVGVAAAYGTKRFLETGLVLAAVAIALNGMVTAIAIDPPGDVMTPLRSFYFARIEQGRFADNLGTLLGAPLWLSLVVPFAVPALAAWHVMRGRVVDA